MDILGAAPTRVWMLLVHVCTKPASRTGVLLLRGLVCLMARDNKGVADQSSEGFSCPELKSVARARLRVKLTLRGESAQLAAGAQANSAR